jgi:hypothetical protein
MGFTLFSPSYRGVLLPKIHFPFRQPNAMGTGESLFLLKDFFGHPARKNRQKLRDR